MKWLLLVYFLLFSISTLAGNPITDSLRYELARAKQDTSRILILARLSVVYRGVKPDSAMFYGQKALALSRQNHFIKGETKALLGLGFAFREIGNLSKAMALDLAALQKAEDNHLFEETATALQYIGVLYSDLNDYPKALTYVRLGLKKFESIHQTLMINASLMNLGETYYRLNQLDSAVFYINQVYKVSNQQKLLATILPSVSCDMGDIQAQLGHTRLALFYYQQSVQVARNLNYYRRVSVAYNQIAELYRTLNQRDSSIYYAKKALLNAQEGPFNKEILASGTLLAKLYESVDDHQALQYVKIASVANDSLYGSQKIKAIQTLLFDEQERKRDIELAKEAYQNQIKQYALLVGLGMFLLIAFILYRNNRQKQKANAVLEKTLSDLKSTQTQLIQKEKMASLGELTAGIAHEIQNPLNFVNNFSEVSTELVEELKEGPFQQLPEADKDYAGEILTDLTQNLQKITQHGGRASSIVKGMLEHSRTSTGERQPTDLNALANEYLRLAYQGFRTKDKSFNCELVCEFDVELPKVEVVPQEIGRVLLNLFNNSFYAVNKQGARNLEQGMAYKPTVWVSTHVTQSSPERALSLANLTGVGTHGFGTKGVDRSIEIRVRDNGTGIPDSIKAKIFQPFFTTKPTGEGTGLGLSLSYDIVTKGHDGTLTLESVEGEGTTFVVSLPIKPN